MSGVRQSPWGRGCGLRPGVGLGANQEEELDMPGEGSRRLGHQRVVGEGAGKDALRLTPGKASVVRSQG